MHDAGAVGPGEAGREGGPRVGPWQLERELGRGGMGVVWAATHESTGRPAAVKVLLAGGDPELLLRFAREQRLVATLDHPGIARVLDLGVERGRPWIAFERYPGPTLEGLVRTTGPLPSSEVAALGASVAGALEHAHARGLVHRDVKPANVLLDAGRRPVLIDFGLARVAAPGHGSVTETGALLGTPAYAAPEVMAGDPRGVDARADVWGLGATLYFLLTGRAPFEGASALAVLEAAATREPTSPRALRPDVAPALDELVLRCLAKDPGARPSTAAALARVLVGLGRAAAHGGSPRAKGGRARRAKVAGAGLAALVVGGAALAFALAGAHASGPATPRPGASAEAPAPSNSGAGGQAPAPVRSRLVARLGARAGRDGGFRRGPSDGDDALGDALDRGADPTLPLGRGMGVALDFCPWPVPAGARLEAATLVLSVETPASPATPLTLRIARAGAAWSEGDSTGDAATPGPRGDAGEAVEAAVHPQDGVLRVDVLPLLAGGPPLHGLLLESAAAAADAPRLEIAAREHVDAARRPALELTWTGPAAAADAWPAGDDGDDARAEEERAALAEADAADHLESSAALARLQPLVRRAPWSGALRLRRASELVLLGAWGAARRDLEAAPRLARPSGDRDAARRAVLLAKLRVLGRDDLQAALPAARAGYDLAPDLHLARVTYGLVCDALGRRDEGLALVEAQLDRAVATGDEAGALHALGVLLEQGAPAARVERALGRVRRVSPAPSRRGDEVITRAAARWALEVSPARALEYLDGPAGARLGPAQRAELRARAHLALGEVDAAIAAAQGSEEHAPWRVEVFLAAGAWTSAREVLGRLPRDGPAARARLEQLEELLRWQAPRGRAPADPHAVGPRVLALQPGPIDGEDAIRSLRGPAAGDQGYEPTAAVTRGEAGERDDRLALRFSREALPPGARVERVVLRLALSRGRAAPRRLTLARPAGLRWLRGASDVIREGGPARVVDAPAREVLELEVTDLWAESVDGPFELLVGLATPGPPLHLATADHPVAHARPRLVIAYVGAAAPPRPDPALLVAARRDAVLAALAAGTWPPDDVEELLAGLCIGRALRAAPAAVFGRLAFADEVAVPDTSAALLEARLAAAPPGSDPTPDLEALLLRRPDDRALRARLGEALLAAGRLVEAARELHAAARGVDEPGDGDPGHGARLARRLAALGAPARARALLAAAERRLAAGAPSAPVEAELALAAVEAALALDDPEQAARWATRGAGDGASARAARRLATLGARGLEALASAWADAPRDERLGPVLGASVAALVRLGRAEAAAALLAALPSEDAPGVEGDLPLLHHLVARPTRR